MTSDTFTNESDPKDFNGGPVEEYLATADAAEVQRVLGLEVGSGGKDRTGVKNAGNVRLTELEGTPGADPQATPAEGLAATGNPLDMSTPNASNVDSAIAHQDSAPAELAKAADEAAEVGYIGTGVAAKADYSQGNPAVMNKES